MNKINRYEIIYRLKNKNPHQKIELKYSSSFELLIAVLLSAKSTDVSVNKVTNHLFLMANTPQAMISLGIDNIKKYIRSIGLFNKKADNIIKICQILLEKYNGKIPENRFALENLPGIGRKISNVVLNVAFGWPTIAVDTHVFRVVNRTHFLVEKNIRKIEKQLLSIVPKVFQIDFHRLLVFHGRYTCRSCKPKCSSCLIEDLCEYKKKNYF